MNADSRQTGSQGADGSAGERPLDFGVFFFAAVGDRAQETYRLMLDAARRADELGFGFVSTPERHFHRFGGAFPNPAVTSAAIAAVTSRIQIRAGSVVTPLHPAARIVEDFAMVDGISNGRVAISVGSGWNVNDFVIAPEKYETRREQMIKDVNGHPDRLAHRSLELPQPAGRRDHAARLPAPGADDLSVWVTASRSEGTFREAGRLGCNILTHLENQDVESLSDKIALYRTARAEAGWDGPGKVTVMMHTYVADDAAEAREVGGGALRDHLLSAIDLEALAVEAGRPDERQQAGPRGALRGERPAQARRARRQPLPVRELADRLGRGVHRRPPAGCARPASTRSPAWWTSSPTRSWCSPPWSASPRSAARPPLLPSRCSPPDPPAPTPRKSPPHPASPHP